MPNPAQVHFRAGWLFSKRLDTWLFFYPILLACGFWFLIHSYGAGQWAFLTFVILQGLGLGPFHQGVTWFYLFDPKLRQHFAGDRTSLIRCLAAFFLILAGSVLGMFFFPTGVYFIYLMWTVQHIVQQNVGILLLYHSHEGLEAVVNRDLEISTIHRAAWLWMLIFFAHLAPEGGLLFAICWLCVLAAAFDLTVLLCKYGFELNKLVRSGRVINLPAQAFWLISLFFLLPFALIGKYDEAILPPLVMHWIQYIGLNLVLTERKYRSSWSGFAGLTPGSVLMLCGVSLVVVTALAGLMVGVVEACHSTIGTTFTGLILGIGMVHYLQDAFLWRFKNPVIRQSMLPYLKEPDPGLIRV